MNETGKRFLFRLGALSGGLLIAAVLCEAVLRALGWGYCHSPVLNDPVLHHAHPRNYSFKVHTPSNEYGGHFIYYDSAGRNVPRKPRSGPSGKKIVFMGDSFVEAVQVPYEKSFPGLAAEDAVLHEVYNFGVSSYSPLLYWLQWQRDIKSMRPDYVFLLLYENDIAGDEKYAAGAAVTDGEVTAVPNRSSDAAWRIAGRSVLARFLRMSYLHIKWRLTEGKKAFFAGNGAAQPAGMTPFTEKYLLRFIEDVKRQNGHFVLMAVPSGHHPSGEPPSFSGKIKEWAEAKGIDYLDLQPWFEAPVKPAFFERDIHFNEHGHELVYQAIKAYLPEIFETP